MKLYYFIVIAAFVSWVAVFSFRTASNCVKVDASHDTYWREADYFHGTDRCGYYYKGYSDPMWTAVVEYRLSVPSGYFPTEDAAAAFVEKVCKK